MTEYQKYRRTQIAEMAEWVEGFDMTGVSVSEPDREAGSPKRGDMIARNPANHADKWLVAAAYFDVNFETLDHGGPAMTEPTEIEREAERADVTLVEYLYQNLAHSRRIASNNAALWGDAQERIEQLEAAVAYAMEHIDEDHYYTLGNMAAQPVPAQQPPTKDS